MSERLDGKSELALRRFEVALDKGLREAAADDRKREADTLAQVSRVFHDHYGGAWLLVRAEVLDR